MEKLPPVEKVYEAWTALADDRYDLSPEALVVRSSDGSKEYRVTWDDGGRYRSNDNATFWQGYAGYPVIMALMLQGRVPFNGEVAAWFKGIPWKALNDAHKRDYAAALTEAFERAGLAVNNKGRVGYCGFCRSRLIKGEYHASRYERLRIADTQYHYFHPCCSYPMSDMEIEVYSK